MAAFYALQGVPLFGTMQTRLTLGKKIKIKIYGGKKFIGERKTEENYIKNRRKGTFAREKNYSQITNIYKNNIGRFIRDTIAETNCKLNKSRKKLSEKGTL